MEMEMELIEMEVYNIINVYSPLIGAIVLKEKAGDYYLVIFVNSHTCKVLAQKIQKIPSSPPLIYDLLKNIITEELGWEIKYLVITEVKDNTFYGNIILKTRKGEELEIECNPSDGIVLSIIAGRPIFATQEIMENCRWIKKEDGLLVPISKTEQWEVDQKLKDSPFGEFIERLDLSDFSN